MELLIFSDSHGRTEGMQEALSRCVGKPGAVIFLGDGLRDFSSVDTDNAERYCVAGNCDVFSLFGIDEEAPEERLLVLEGHTLLLTHGHRFGVKGGCGALTAYAASKGADIVLFGHTHTPFLQILPKGTVIGGVPLSRPMYLFNPGSVSHDTDGEGKSFGTLLLRRDTVLFSHGRL